MLSDVIAFNDAYPDQTRFRFGQDILQLSDAFDLDLARERTTCRISKKAASFREQVSMTPCGCTTSMRCCLVGRREGTLARAPVIRSASCRPGTCLLNGAPYGVTFCGTAWSEPRLIGLAFAFEQATMMSRIRPASTPPLTP